MRNRDSKGRFIKKDLKKQRRNQKKEDKKEIVEEDLFKRNKYFKK